MWCPLGFAGGPKKSPRGDGGKNSMENLGPVPVLPDSPAAGRQCFCETSSLERSAEAGTFVPASSLERPALT